MWSLTNNLGLLTLLFGGPTRKIMNGNASLNTS